MKNQLSEYVNSFSSQSRRSVYSVLSDVSKEKTEIGRLVGKLSSYVNSADYAPRIVRQLEPMQREFLIDMFRDIDLRVKTQFDISNSLSLISSAMENVFGGELEKIENDLQYLSSYIDNYSFISGEDDLYNSSFVENFDNESNSYVNENSSLTISDRDGIPFNLSMASKVDPVSGKLKYSADYELSLVQISSSQIKSINVETNFPKEYMSSDTGISNVLNNSSSKSWSTTIKSPFVIKESLLDSEKYIDFKNEINIGASAQLAVTFEFNSLISMSRLRINPNMSYSLGVGQIIIETEDSNNSSSSSQSFKKKALLTSPIYIDKNYDIDFDKTYSIKSMTIIFFQKNYTRTKNVTIQNEINSKMLSSIYQEASLSRKESHDTLQDFVIRYFLKDTDKSFVLRNKKVYSYNYTKYFPTPLSKTNFGAIEKLAKNTYFSDLDSFNKFKNTSLLSNIVFSVIAYSLGSKLRNQISSSYVESNIRDMTRPLGSFASSGLMPIGDSNIVDKNIHFFEQTFNSIQKDDVTQLLNASEPTDSYEYGISMGSISFFNKSSISTNVKNKSYFVSKKINTNGRPLKVKMLADYFEELSYSSLETSDDKTSVEFSVSISDNPQAEADWLPIVPYSESFIRSELLIANSNGDCSLRFEPLPESIIMYENGIRRISGLFISNGKNIKINGFNPANKYFVSYTLKYPSSAREVPLHSGSLATPVLVTPNFSGSSGEYFSSLPQSNRIRLSYNPYIDYSKYANASYSSYVGTITSAKTTNGNLDNSNYSPIKIIFEDGTVAINLTNYILNNNEIESFYESDSVLFIHYGDSLIFNNTINKPFRVLYQYIPDSFRYRVVMRSLTNDQQNYSIDRLIFKYSNENRDNMLINLIKYDNLFKNKVN